MSFPQFPLQDFKIKFQSVIQEIQTRVEPVIKNIGNKTTPVLQDIQKKVLPVVEKVQTIAQPYVVRVQEGYVENTKMIKRKLEQLQENPMVQNAMHTTGVICSQVKENAKNVTKDGCQVLENMLETAAASVKKLKMALEEPKEDVIEQNQGNDEINEEKEIPQDNRN